MRRLARDVLVMALATGLSRLLGLARETAIASRFGTSAAYDAFLIAFFVPNLLRGLLAEGALSTAFVPIYARLMAGAGGTVDDRRRADAFANNLLSLLLVLFPITVAVGAWLAPYYVPFLASGFSPEKMALAVSLTRVVFPFLALIGFAAVFMGILNAHHRFFAASIAPVWFNAGMILGVLVVARALPDAPILGLAFGVLIGGAAQLASQVPALRRLRFAFRFQLLPVHPDLAELARRIAPAVLALAAAQINLLVDNKIASYLPDGGIASLQYAMRLFQLPLGVFAVSIGTALLPRLSVAHARAEATRVSKYLADGITSTALVLLPAMVGLLIVGRDVIGLLFEHGSFGPEAATRTFHALSAYVVGLLPYGLVYVQGRACYALGRTVLPLLASASAVGVNVALDLALVGPLQEAGLALATAAAGTVNAAVLYLFLRSSIGWSRDEVKRLATIVLASAILGGAVFGARHLLGSPSSWIAVVVPTLVGLGVYLLIARVTGLRSLVVGLGRRPDSEE